MPKKKKKKKARKNRRQDPSRRSPQLKQPHQQHNQLKRPHDISQQGLEALRKESGPQSTKPLTASGRRTELVSPIRDWPLPFGRKPSLSRNEALEASRRALEAGRRALEDIRPAHSIMPRPGQRPDRLPRGLKDFSPPPPAKRPKPHLGSPRPGGFEEKERRRNEQNKWNLDQVGYFPTPPIVLWNRERMEKRRYRDLMEKRHRPPRY
jgi:hypothetical protein